MKNYNKKIPEVKCPIQCKGCPSENHCFIKQDINRLKKLRQNGKNLIVIDEMLKILETPDYYNK